jgi:choline dehydrogenase-like flavoprotein
VGLSDDGLCKRGNSYDIKPYMIADLVSDFLPQSLEADVCVIGSGPVGITLALALSRRNARVILLESGGRKTEPVLQDLYRSTNIGRNHNGINIGRHRVFGGNSSQWGGQILPFAPIDFVKREWVEASGWPISFDDLKPYYIKALDFEGLGDCLMDDDEVWAAVRMEAPDFGAGLGSHFSRWCPQRDFALLHGREIDRSNSLRCILHATVTALSCRDDLIVAALARSLTGNSLRIHASRFAFCVGGIETARLLLQPLENQTAPPWTRCSDILGRYFQDHPTFECADVTLRHPAAVHQLMDIIYHRGLRYQPRLYLSAARAKELNCLNAGGVLSFKTEISAEVLHQVRVAARQFLSGSIDRAAMAAGLRSGVQAAPLIARMAWRYLVQKRAFNPSDGGCRLLAFVEQAPNPSSRLTLSDERDALGMFRSKLDWRVQQSEIDTLANFAKEVKVAFESKGLADVDIEKQVVARDPAFVSRCWDNFHDMGCARMATGPDAGAVDANLRLFGSKNGYVCSSAAFPSGSFANPTHTAIALAVRLADHLRSRQAA